MSGAASAANTRTISVAAPKPELFRVHKSRRENRRHVPRRFNRGSVPRQVFARGQPTAASSRSRLVIANSRVKGRNEQVGRKPRDNYESSEDENRSLNQWKVSIVDR